MGQNHYRFAVCQHVGQTFLRVRRIKRHVGAAGFQGSQHGDDHVGTAWNADGDACIRFDAKAAQVMRQAVGTDVQFGIADLLAFMRNGNRIRCSDCLRFEQVVDAVVLRVSACRVVPVNEDLASFCGRQDVDTAHQRVRRCFQCGNDGFDRLMHVMANPCGLYALRHLHVDLESLFQVIDRYQQGIVGALSSGYAVHAFPVVAVFLGTLGTAATVAVVEQGSEQRRRRRDAAAALRQCQAGVFMVQQVSQFGVGLFDAALDALVLNVDA